MIVDKVLDKITRNCITITIKFNDTKILFDSDDKFPDYIPFIPIGSWIS